MKKNKRYGNEFANENLSQLNKILNRSFYFVLGFLIAIILMILVYTENPI